MWTARILLLAVLLLAGGGWFDKVLPRRQKTALLLGVPVVFALSYLPEIRETYVHACAAPCAFVLLIALLCPTAHPIGAALCAALGGLLGWKLNDLFPLFFEPGLLIAVPTALLSVFYCRDANAKALALAAAPFVSLFLRAVGDYTLFQSAVLSLGDGDALCAQAVGFLLLLLGGALLNRFPDPVRRLHAAVQSGGDQRGQRYG